MRLRRAGRLDAFVKSSALCPVLSDVSLFLGREELAGRRCPAARTCHPALARGSGVGNAHGPILSRTPFGDVVDRLLSVVVFTARFHKLALVVPPSEERGSAHRRAHMCSSALYRLASCCGPPTDMGLGANTAKVAIELGNMGSRANVAGLPPGTLRIVSCRQHAQGSVEKAHRRKLSVEAVSDIFERNGTKVGFKILMGRRPLISRMLWCSHLRLGQT